MKILDSILAYAFMVGVTVGLMSVPHAIVYEHPRLVFSSWVREDLNV